MILLVLCNFVFLLYVSSLRYPSIRCGIANVPLESHSLVKRPLYVTALGQKQYAIISNDLLDGVNAYLEEKAVVYTKRLIKSYILRKISHTFDKIKNVFSTIHHKIARIYNDALENRKKAIASKHPLRHTKWVINCTYQSNDSDSLIEREEIQFFEDGSLVTSSGVGGCWYSDFGDVTWKIPSKDGTFTYFNAQICWNSCRPFAFMRRGVIFRDRSPNGWIPRYLLRPVVGKFTAHGIE